MLIHEALKKNWLIALAIVLAASIIGGVWYWSKNTQLQSYVNEITNMKYEWQKTKDNEQSLQNQISAMLRDQEKVDTRTRLYAQASSTITGGIYTNNTYKFSFKIPADWEFTKEETNAGGDPLRISLTTAKARLNKDDAGDGNIVAIVYSNRNFERASDHIRIGGDEGKKITVGGREALRTSAYYESTMKITGVAVSNGDHSIELFFYDDTEPYLSQLQDVLNSFKFIE